MATTDEVLGTATASSSGITASGGKYRAPVATLGEILDLYIVHVVFALLFVVGGIMLMVEFARFSGKTSGIWGELFYAIGFLSLAMNAGFVLGFIIAWLLKSAGFLSRQDASIHWLHALSIFAAAFGVVWTVLALILTFGSTFTQSNSNGAEAAGYFMILLSGAFFAYLVVRYMFGLAGSGREPSPDAARRPDVSADAYATLEARFRAAAAANASAQPIFGGGGRGGSAAFGGIDLGGLQTSSMSMLPPVSSSYVSPTPCGPQGGGGMGGGYSMPMMMFPPMMMAAPQQQQYCAPQNPDAIHIS